MRLADETVEKLRWLPGALLAVAASATALEARRLGLGSASQPGAGFFPFWLSVALAVVAVLLAAGVSRGGATARPPRDSPGASVSIVSFLALAGYGALLSPLGFIPSTLLFFLLQVRVIERMAWKRAVLLSAAATGAACGLFTLLDVRLPAGLWLE